MKTCASCGTESDGRFCPQCGSSLEEGRCSECDAVLPPGARYCTQCGGAVGGRPSPIAAHLHWYVGAVAIIAVAAVLILPSVFGGDDGARLAPGVAPPPGTGGAPVGGAPAAGEGDATPPPLTGSPREQADRLFNRVMAAAEAGDTSQARFFVPMAIQAYEIAAPLDMDGLYHKAVLELTAGQVEDARSTAQQILDGTPNHLLALGVAARAADLSGEAAEADRLYRRLLDSYDTESREDRPEYVDHAGILPIYRDEARAYVEN